MAILECPIEKMDVMEGRNIEKLWQTELFTSLPFFNGTPTVYKQLEPISFS